VLVLAAGSVLGPSLAADADSDSEADERGNTPTQPVDFFGDEYAPLREQVLEAMERQAGTRAASPSPPPTDQSKSSGWSPEELEKLREAEEARRERRSAPELQAQRTESRTAYADTTGAEAVGILDERLAGVLEALTAEPLQLAADDRVAAFPSPFSALVKGSDGEAEEARLVDSTVPLRSSVGSGKPEPVDPTLEQTAKGFEPRNPAVPIEVSNDIAEGVLLEGSRISVSPAAASDPPELAHGAAVFPNSERDTDAVVSSAPLGAQLGWQLRSAVSPESLDLRFDLPDGAVLEVGEKSGLASVKDAKGQVLALVQPPVAFDAEGEPVPSSYRAEGNVLTVVVDHVDRDLMYPLFVDPVVVDRFRLDGQGQQNDPFCEDDWGGWEYSSSSSSFPGAIYCGLITQAVAGAPPGWGQWRYRAPRAAWIEDMDFHVSHNPAGGTCVGEGVFSYTRNGWEPGYWTHPNPYVPLTPPRFMASPWIGAVGTVAEQLDPLYRGNSCLSLSNNYKHHGFGAFATPGNEARMQLLQFSQSSALSVGVLAASAVFLNDGEYPGLYVSRNDLPTAWSASSSGRIDAVPGDSGLGVSFSYLLLPKAGGSYADVALEGCTSTHGDWCPGLSLQSFFYDTDDVDPNTVGAQPMPEGINRVNLAVADPTWKVSQTGWDVKIDRSGPALSLSGELYDRRDTTLPAGSYALTMSAQDGNPSGPDSAKRSGVKSVEVFLDGERVDGADQPCPAGSCSLSRTYSLDTADQYGGERRVRVLATDQAGNTSQQEFNVTIPPTGELLLPRDGTRTSRRIRLQAHAEPAFSSVRFQYRRRFGQWIDIPLNSLFSDGGQPLGSQSQPLPGGTSPVIVWDVPATFPLGGADGPMEVRASFSGSSQGISRPASFTLDGTGMSSDDASESIGPGSVNLLTGNFSYSADDISIASFAQSLTLTRTYNSRAPATRTDPMFGAGWTSSVAVDEAGSDYASLQEKSDPLQGDWVELLASDGTTIFFFRTGDHYEPERGYEDLALTKPDTTHFKLTDSDKNATTFGQQTAGTFTPTEIRQPGSANKTSYSWQLVNGQARVTRALAPSVVDCDDVLLRGCRALDFVYASTTTANGSQLGDYAGRLKEVKLTTWDNASQSMQPDTVAAYEYDDLGRLRGAWDPRISPALKESYAYDSQGRLTTVTPPGEAAWALNYQQLADDADGGRLRSAGRQTPQGVATTTVAYRVPLSGAGAPYAMGQPDVAAWSQEDLPVDATAVFPPDQVPDGSAEQLHARHRPLPERARTRGQHRRPRRPHDNDRVRPLRQRRARAVGLEPPAGAERGRAVGLAVGEARYGAQLRG
jgi:hypothetical protein